MKAKIEPTTRKETGRMDMKVIEPAAKQVSTEDKKKLELASEKPAVKARTKQPPQPIRSHTETREKIEPPPRLTGSHTATKERIKPTPKPQRSHTETKARTEPTEEICCTEGEEIKPAAKLDFTEKEGNRELEIAKYEAKTSEVPTIYNDDTTTPKLVAIYTESIPLPKTAPNSVAVYTESIPSPKAKTQQSTGTVKSQ